MPGEDTRNITFFTCQNIGFISELLNIRGAPIIDVSYMHTIRDNTYKYLDDLRTDKWIENYGFVEFRIKWGI